MFHLARVADHALIPDDDMLANVCVMPDLAIPADDGWAFYHGSVFHNCSRADINVLCYVSHPIAMIVEAGPQVPRDICLELPERVPGKLAALEQGRVLRLAQVQQLGWLEHGPSVGKRPRCGKVCVVRTGTELPYLVCRRASTAAPVTPALSPSFDGIISTPFIVPGIA